MWRWAASLDLGQKRNTEVTLMMVMSADPEELSSPFKNKDSDSWKWHTQLAAGQQHLKPKVDFSAGLRISLCQWIHQTQSTESATLKTEFHTSLGIQRVKEGHGWLEHPQRLFNTCYYMVVILAGKHRKRVLSITPSLPSLSDTMNKELKLESTEAVLQAIPYTVTL